MPDVPSASDGLSRQEGTTRPPPRRDFAKVVNPPPGAIAPRNELERLLLGLDPAGPLVDKWRQYLEVYDRFFAAWRGKPVRFLELGVSQGGSLALWRRYFGEAATIVGIDIDPRCARFDGPNGRIVIGDQADAALLARTVDEMGGVDIVLDDGSHVFGHQIETFRALFPRLAEGGLYLCEDLHSSYWADFGGGYRRGGASFIEFLKDLIDQMHAWYHAYEVGPEQSRQAVFGLSVFDSIAVIEKRRIEKPYRLIVGRNAF